MKKKPITTYFRPDALKQIDDYCKKANVSRANFLEIASKHYINSIENEPGVLSYGYSSENWIKNKVDDFLKRMWDVYFYNEKNLLNEVLLSLSISSCYKYQNMIEIHGLKKICQILINCIEKEVNQRTKKHFLK